MKRKKFLKEVKKIIKEERNYLFLQERTTNELEDILDQLEKQKANCTDKTKDKNLGAAINQVKAAIRIR